MTSVITRTIARILVPFIQLFGLYVVAHGPVSPGGGFQGGVIVGASVILLGLCYELATAEQRLGHRIRIIMDSAGALMYAGIGLLALLAGGTFLDYGIIPLGLARVQTRALMILAIGVAIGVHMIALEAALFLHLAEDHEA